MQDASFWVKARVLFRYNDLRLKFKILEIFCDLNFFWKRFNFYNFHKSKFKICSQRYELVNFSIRRWYTILWQFYILENIHGSSGEAVRTSLTDCVNFIGYFFFAVNMKMDSIMVWYIKKIRETRTLHLRKNIHWSLSSSNSSSSSLVSVNGSTYIVLCSALVLL